MDPVDFLGQHAPFADIPSEHRHLLGEGLEITYVERGSQLLERGGAPARWLSVVRKGELIVRGSGGSQRTLGPGDCFGQASLISGQAPAIDVECSDDCLIYTLSKSTFEALSRVDPGFSGFFMADLARRLRQRAAAPVPSDASALSAPVRSILKRKAACGPASLTIREAAQRMAQASVSSLILTEDGAQRPIGIVTDRDLRRRVVAAGLDTATAVSEIMSTPVHGEAASASVFDAMLTMVQRKIHHLPILESEGEIAGVLTHDDLLRHVFHSPASLVKRIRRLDLEHTAGDYAEQVTGLVRQLVQSGLGAVHIGSMVASLNDALLVRHCQLAQQRLGPPPCDYAWIAFGSEGRKEQALLTDQDNALVYADAAPDQKQSTRAYFEELARIVVNAAIASGIPPCKGGYMATNWCMELSKWVETIESWTHQPTPEAVMHAANFFDFRVIHGQLDTGRMDAAMLDGTRQPRFMAHFVRQVLDKGPRKAFLSRWLDLDRDVDLKAEGLVPLVGMARIYALSAGQRQGSTPERLAIAHERKLIESDRAESLEEAFQFLFRLRLEHQLAADLEGSEQSNQIRLGALPALDRRHLRDVLDYIDDARSSLANRYGTAGLG